MLGTVAEARNERERQQGLSQGISFTGEQEQVKRPLHYRKPGAVWSYQSSLGGGPPVSVGATVRPFRGRDLCLES